MSVLLRPLTLALLVSVAAACGDDLDSPGADAGPPGGGDAGPDGGGPGATCETQLAAASLEGGAWDTRFSVAGFTGHDGIAPNVHDFAIDTDGSLIAAGTFQYFGGERVPPLMRLRDGAWEPARTSWELPPPPAGFGAVAVSDDGVLALATADDFGERNGEIWIDDGSGLRSIGAFDGQVRTLAWYGGRLWVAGTFAMEDATIIGLAAWDGTGWSAAPGGPIDGFAFELLRDGDELLVGGEFTTVGGVEAAAVAAYDGAAWRALDLPGARVYALVRGEDGELYAGGALGALEPGTGGIARWDGSAWQPVGGGLAMYGWPGVVTDLVALDGSVHATGCFNSAGGAPDSEQATPAIGSLARWDGATWHSYPGDDAPVRAPWFHPFVCGDEGPTAIFDVAMQRLAVSGDRLLVGGALPGAGGV
ncbi:MAG TPA: hypothetical protein VKZ63_16275, partial [Kofleriaceae bacterium]|nr:hypothetical protein [Kofleriaceae bacterium]